MTSHENHQFSKDYACCEIYLMDTKHNNLHLVSKISWNVCPWTSSVPINEQLSENKVHSFPRHCLLDNHLAVKLKTRCDLSNRRFALFELRGCPNCKVIFSKKCFVIF